MENRYKQEIAAFGKRVRQLREAKGMTQLDLDMKIELNRTEISKIENGLKNIEFYTIVRIAEGLEVSLSELFQSSK